MSLNFTYRAPRIKPTPRAKKYSSTKYKGRNIIRLLSGTWLKAIKTKTITRLANMVKNEVMLLEKTKTILGKYTFRIRSRLFTIEYRQVTVVSVKKVHTTIPSNRYTGQ
jgi:hypothetical protein